VPSLRRKRRPRDQVAAADERAKVFRQNVAAEFQRLEWARSATKHRISKTRARHVLENCLAILEEDPPPGHPNAIDPRLVFLGEDPEGVALEVIAVETDQELLTVIHVMELRPRYRGTYEEVRRCNR
jgi:hypothetical protein